MSYFLVVLVLLLNVLTVTIMLRSLISWIMPGQINFFTNALYQLTEPILVPVRKIIPKWGRIDFSPFVAVVILQVIVQIVASVK